MQLRKTVNHPYLFVDEYTVDEMLVKASGKFECLDRMLPKLLHFKHKTLIFSQMTQVLDLMADYLDLRGIKYERLDGSVGLQERSVFACLAFALWATARGAAPWGDLFVLCAGRNELICLTAQARRPWCLCFRQGLWLLWPAVCRVVVAPSLSAAPFRGL